VIRARITFTTLISCITTGFAMQPATLSNRAQLIERACDILVKNITSVKRDG